jgi:unsaturated rhamnogalacturonyl hydrolase
MKIKTTVLLIFFLAASFVVFSQEKINTSFKTDLNKTDIKTVLKEVADWQVKAPLTHDPADWTNGALYAGMAEWAGISGNDYYFEWLKGISEKNRWSYMVRKNPLGRYHADDYCVGQTYIELYRKYKDKNMIRTFGSDTERPGKG